VPRACGRSAEFQKRQVGRGEDGCSCILSPDDFATRHRRSPGRADLARQPAGAGDSTPRDGDFRGKPAIRSAPRDLELKRLEVMPRDQTWDRDARAADTRLNGLIAECCGNLRLAVEIGRYLVLFRALRDVCHLRDAGRNYSRADDVPEHLAIIRPLLQSDAEGAARAMDSHIRSAAVTLEEVVFRDRETPEVPWGAEALPEVVNNKQP
jgi:hypothetical protein